MAKQFLYATDVTGVVAASSSGKMTVKYPPSGRYANLKTTVVKSGAVATLDVIRTSITEMRAILPGNNAEVISRIRPADYLAILAANGYTNAAGLLPRYWGEPWRATVVDEEILALDARRYGGIHYEYDVTNDANPLSFQHDYEFDDRPSVDAAGREFFGIINHTTQIEDLGGGEPVVVLDPVDGDIQRLYIVTPSTVTLSRVQVMLGQSGNVVPYDRTQTATYPGLQWQLKDMGMTIPAAYAVPGGTNANIWPLVFDNNQQLRNIVATAGTPVRLKLTLSAAAQVRIIRETRLAR